MTKDKIEKSKMILWGIVIAVVILLLLLSLGFGVTRSGAGESNARSGSAASNDYSSLPEKCRPPAGQDIEAWKEHLGHHAETQECLDYFKNQ